MPATATHLTDQDRWAIVNALNLAAEVYRRDAQVSGKNGSEFLEERFKNQETQVRRIAEAIEEAERIELG